MNDDDQEVQSDSFRRGQIRIGMFGDPIGPHRAVVVSVPKRPSGRFGIVPLTSRIRLENPFGIVIESENADRLIKVNETRFLRRKRLRKLVGYADDTILLAIDNSLKTLFELNRDHDAKSSELKYNFGDIHLLAKGCEAFPGAQLGRPVLIVSNKSVVSTGSVLVMPFNLPGYAYPDHLDVGLPWTVAPTHMKDLKIKMLEKTKFCTLAPEGIIRTKEWLRTNFELGPRQGRRLAPI